MRIALVSYAYDDGEYEKGEGGGEGGASDGGGDAWLAAEAFSGDDRVGEKGVRGLHARKEDVGEDAVVEDVKATQYAEGHWDEEGYSSEGHTLAAVLPEVVDVGLEAREELYIVDADPPEE